MALSSKTRTASITAAVLFTAQFALMGAAYLILSSAINWPISLDDPASIALPRILEHADSVMIGYSCYLMVSLLMIPATAAFNKRLGITGARADLTMALATFAAITKTIGIGRWLFVMPSLAQAYIAPSADKAAIELMFDALNAYAGSIGEVMGVGFASGIWTLLIAASVFRADGMTAKFLGVFTFLVGLSLFATIPAGFGLDLGPILTISGVAWNVALFAIGIWGLRTSHAPTNMRDSQ
jgi:Domain of unknown function (DUF4386)